MTIDVRAHNRIAWDALAERGELESDARLAERHGLAIATVRGDMANLEMFAKGAFDRTGRLEVTHSLPYADAARPADEPLEFSHTLKPGAP